MERLLEPTGILTVWIHFVNAFVYLFKDFYSTTTQTGDYHFY